MLLIHKVLPDQVFVALTQQWWVFWTGMPHDCISPKMCSACLDFCQWEYSLILFPICL